MKYTVEALCLEDFAAVSKRLEKWPILRSLWRAALPLLLVMCYFGVLFAVAGFEALPFQILAWCKMTPATAAYWILADIWLDGIVTACSFVAVIFWRSLQAGRISIDLIVLF